MFSWPQIALALAVVVLALHLAFILWVMFGAVFTRGRTWLAWVHILCAAYGVVIEVGPWPCPLTIAENWFEMQAGRMPYQGPFLLHYLDLLVYPHIPPSLLTWLAVVVLGVNVFVYVRRWRRASTATRG